MQITFKGYCPIQEKENYPVTIAYNESSNLSGNINYTKGFFECKYDPYGDKCPLHKCPIYAEAPNNL